MISVAPGSPLSPGGPCREDSVSLTPETDLSQGSAGGCCPLVAEPVYYNCIC